MATAKFIKNNAGVLAEESAVTTSAGAGDSGKIPALNTSGVLDSSIVDSSATSAADKVVKMDGTGRIALGMLPVGVGADTVAMTTSEAIAGGDLVNIWDNSGAKVRKADATIAGKEAHGFVLVGAASGATVDVYFEGSNTAMTGLVAGKRYLSTTAGTSTATAPSGTGNVVQIVGFATGTTSMNFQSGTPITLV